MRPEGHLDGGGEKLNLFLSPGSVEMVEENKQKAAPKRCEFDSCRHKLGLTSFSCRCGHYFCNTHRHAEDHNCSHDFKEDGKKELLKFMSSPVIKSKIEVL